SIDAYLSYAKNKCTEAYRYSTRDVVSPDPENPHGGTAARLWHRAAYQALIRRSATHRRGLALPGLATDAREGLGDLRVGSGGAQATGTRLPPYRVRPQAARNRGLDIRSEERRVGKECRSG